MVGGMGALLVRLPEVTVIASAPDQQPQRGLQIRPSLMMMLCWEPASVASFASGCDVVVTAAAAGLASAMDAAARLATAPVAVA
jgi:hypothetical protein